MSDSILDAFQRFDKDGTGSISRDELADVLQLLDQAWDNNSIDRLLLQADASGDGELQIEEFLRWIFAETSEVAKMEVAIGNFTYVLSGCSRKNSMGSMCKQVPASVGGLCSTVPQIRGICSFTRRSNNGQCFTS